MTAHDNSPRPGDLIGQRCGGSYVITSLLGEGGCGQVYLATSDMMAGKKCAVKILHPDITRRPEGLARFYGEVYAAGRIEDPNIVEVFDAGKLDDGRMYMMMQYCAGGSLDSLIEKRGALPLELAFSLGSSVAQAIHAAHESNVIHRDIKPANILLINEPGGLIRAMLADFGIAKLIDEQFALAMMTGTKKMLGSPGYMSPEQCGRARSVDGRADIYAFASVLYEMVTGRRPYPGNSMFELINDVIKGAPFPRPRELRPDLPAEFDAVIMAGLAHRREDRISSVKEMMQRIARVVRNGEGLLSYFAPRLVSKNLAPTAATISEGIGPAATQWASGYATVGDRRSDGWSRRLALLVAGAVVGTAATALVSWTHSDHGNETAMPSHTPIAVSVDASDVQVTAMRAVVAPTTSATPVEAQPDASSLAVVHVDASLEVAARRDADVRADAGALVVRADAGADAAQPVARRDAGVAPTRVAAVPDARESDTGTSGTRPSRMTAKTPRTQQAPLQYGALHVEADPWADVTIVGQKDTYTTPVTTPLPTGHYRVVLTKGTQKATLDVTIKQDETTHIQRVW